LLLLFFFFFFAAAVSVSFTGKNHQEGSSPSHAAGRRLGGFLHHHEMLLDNFWSFVHNSARGSSSGWFLQKLEIWLLGTKLRTATEQQLSPWMRKRYGNSGSFIFAGFTVHLLCHSQLLAELSKPR